MNTPLLDLTMNVAVEASLKGYSRDQEREADIAGVRYATRAGYDAAGLRNFLQAVQDTGTQPAKSGLFANWGSTHPGGLERLKAQDDAVKTAPAGGRKAVPRFEQQVVAKLPPQPAQAAPAPAKPATK
jgi:predicted Zn-dependent protease